LAWRAPARFDEAWQAPNSCFLARHYEPDWAAGRSSLLTSCALAGTSRSILTPSIKLKHADVAEGRLDQDARQVNTKFSKTFTTWFFPVGDDILEIVVDWVTYLRKEKLWGLDDPLFPATKIAIGPCHHFEASGLDRKHWTSA
jgi:hypothetical protein